MTRRQFGGGTADFVATTATASGVTGLLQVAVTSVTFWTAATGGSRITDLLDHNGAAATAINTDARGQLLTFQGPADGTDVMWADAGGPSRQLLFASDTGSIISVNQIIVRAAEGQTADPISVFDSAGNPISGTPLAGGDYVSGDNFRVFAPGDIFNPVVKLQCIGGGIQMAKGDPAGAVGALAVGDVATPPSAQPDGTHALDGSATAPGSLLYSRSGRIYLMPGSGCAEEAGLPTLRRVGRIQSDVAAATVNTSGLPNPTLTGTAANADNPLLCGAVSLTTAASSGASAGVVPASFSQAYGAWQPMYWARIVTGPDITNIRYWAGLFSADPSGIASPTGIHVAGFRYDTGVSGTAFWRCVTSAASATPTVVTTTAAIAANTMYDLRVEWNHNNSQIRFLINDVVVAAITTTMPTYNQLLAPGVWVTALTAAAKAVLFSRLVLTHAG